MNRTYATAELKEALWRLFDRPEHYTAENAAGMFRRPLEVIEWLCVALAEEGRLFRVGRVAGQMTWETITPR
jgi:hypothetical protein